MFRGDLFLGVVILRSLAARPSKTLPKARSAEVFVQVRRRVTDGLRQMVAEPCEVDFRTRISWLSQRPDWDRIRWTGMDRWPIPHVMITAIGR